MIEAFPLAGVLDISGHDAPGVTIGSLADSSGTFPGAVFLGANNLTVGSNNLSTTFSGVVQDGGAAGVGSGGRFGGNPVFLENSTAGSGTLINNGAAGPDASGGSTTFLQDSTAGFATLIANGGTNGGRGVKFSLRCFPLVTLVAHPAWKSSATASSISATVKVAGASRLAPSRAAARPRRFKSAS